MNNGENKTPSNMLTCLPQSLCSWNFRVLHSDAQIGTITTHFLTEQGSFHLQNQEWTIRKPNFLTGQWNLEREGITQGKAQKQNIFQRTFDIEYENTSWLLKAKSAFGRGFEIRRHEKVVGMIEPVHAFTRRSTIDCSDELPQPAQLFCFWLAMIIWKRAQNSNGGS